MLNQLIEQYFEDSSKKSKQLKSNFQIFFKHIYNKQTLIRKNLIPETSNSHGPYQPACIKNPDHTNIDQSITPLHAWPIWGFFFKMNRNLWRRYLVIANENENNFGCHKLKRLIPICYLFILCLFNKQDRQVWQHQSQIIKRGCGGGETILIFIILFCTIFSFIYNKNNFFIIYIQKKGPRGIFQNVANN